MSIIRAGLSAHCREKQSSRRVSGARVVSSGHCTTKRAEREVLPGESEKRFAFFDKWACTIPCGRISALSGLPIASHLPQRGRRVFPPCLGFAGLFHVKHARLALSRVRERVPALSGLPWASHLPQRGRQVSPSCRGVTGLFHVKRGPDWPKLWAGKRAIALSALLVTSHLPQRGRRVFASCRGFAGLFHVKHARLALSRERERVPALSGLPWASHLPQRGRQVFPPCLGFAGLFHVKRKRQRSFRLAASPVGNE